MIAKEAEHQLQMTVFTSRADRGVQAMLELLQTEQIKLNSQWPSKSGDDLTRAQGEAQQLTKLIKIITKGPTLQEKKDGAGTE